MTSHALGSPPHSPHCEPSCRTSMHAFGNANLSVSATPTLSLRSPPSQNLITPCPHLTLWNPSLRLSNLTPFLTPTSPIPTLMIPTLTSPQIITTPTPLIMRHMTPQNPLPPCLGTSPLCLVLMADYPQSNARGVLISVCVSTVVSMATPHGTVPSPFVRSSFT
jgi:hypothetical protein